ncbi:MAG: hypothetical protein AB7U75_21725 [Hyphomicrobiaceae bacterium]
MSDNKHSTATPDLEDDDLELLTLDDVIDGIVNQADQCLGDDEGPLYPKARANFAEEYPNATAEQLDEHVARYIAWCERIDREDVGDRGEDGCVIAPDALLKNFGCRHPTFRSALRELEYIHASLVESESGGREAIICALRITLKLIERLPLFVEDRDKLFEPLRLLQTGLTALDRGSVIPALNPAKRGKGRPPESIRAEEFRIRCVMAVVAWSQPGLDDSEPKAIRRVYRSAKDTAEWIGITGKAKCGGFSPTTIENWLTRHNAACTRYQSGKCTFEEMPREIIARGTLDYVILTRREVAPRNVRAASGVESTS